MQLVLPFPVVKLSSFNIVLIFISEGHISSSDHSNQKHWAIISFGSFFPLSLYEKSLSVTIQMKNVEQYYQVVLFILLYKMVRTIKFVYEILKCDHSSKSC